MTSIPARVIETRTKESASIRVKPIVTALAFVDCDCIEHGQHSFSYSQEYGWIHD